MFEIMDLLEKKVIYARIIITKRKEDFKSLFINYSYGMSQFGNFFFAYYNDELCYLKFYDTDFQSCLEQLQQLYPNASFFYEDEFQHFEKLKIVLKGSEFDINVWNELLKIKRGGTVSYSDIAVAIGNPKSVRAVGNAVGRNNIAYIVPCHRVIQKSGSLGGFSSGPHRKLKMLSFEKASIK